VNAFREIAGEIKHFLNTPHNPVGVQILEGAKRDNSPATPQRFCILEREDLTGAEHVFHFGDLECPGAALALGMTQPQYVEVEPRIHRPVVAARVGPLKEADVVLFTVTPRQAMILAILTGGIEAHCKGEHAICGEVIARVYESGRPHLSLLCQGVRELCGFQDDELVVGIPWDLFLTLPGEISRRASVRATF
jgi:uncharacterized protein (DUF169 family)